MDRTLVALVVGFVGIAAAYAGVTGNDPRALLAGILSRRKVPAKPLFGGTTPQFGIGQSTNESAAARSAGVSAGTKQLRIILSALQAAGLLVDGRICGSDTLGGEATSEHFHCNAKDLMVGSNAALGNRIATFLASGLTSGALPIHCVIWNRRIISRENPVWHSYNGLNPHTDHVHVSGWPSVGGAC